MDVYVLDTLKIKNKETVLTLNVGYLDAVEWLEIGKHVLINRTNIATITGVAFIKPIISEGYKALRKEITLDTINVKIGDALTPVDISRKD
ncbi:hypothetical protein ITQ84_01330 [Pediococcus pentosaceus]|uniref:hypothetical protein n=1 Tax=Pediococcus pentosaceus TaxID=1255 RepID=UPI0018A16BED|nr:hypothetical protein [Pediococcus pentosaceus]MBF7139098.1 hypothetical protein [Pediococcus pentosaceus]MCM6820606.1 hypothetical protein [Pediococcus pentosaceus]